MKTFSYDFHVHSFPRSFCARASVEEMCQAAVDAGLTGIALTEHNVWWKPSELEDLRAGFPGLTILGGVEVTGLEHHFLTFLPEMQMQDDELWVLEVPEMVARVHQLGGIVVWAHPFRFHNDVPDWLESTRLDGIEVDSTHMNRHSSALASAIARKQGLFAMQNTDAHDVSVMGLHCNVLSQPLASEADLIEKVMRR